MEEEKNEVVEEEEEKPTTDWEAKAKEFEGRNKRLETKLKKASEPKEVPEPEVPEKSGDRDYGEKTFINQVLGVELGKEDEMKLVKEYEDNGKKLDDLASNKHFQNDLKDMRDADSVKEATPSNSKRATTSARDTVGYWIKKGELPPSNQRELRVKVVNERMKEAKTGDSEFTDNPVVN